MELGFTESRLWYPDIDEGQADCIAPMGLLLTPSDDAVTFAQIYTRHIYDLDEVQHTVTSINRISISRAAALSLAHAIKNSFEVL